MGMDRRLFKTGWAGLLLFLILFGCRNNAETGLPAPRHGGVYVVAHRGAHNGIPENTLPAYQKAIDLGADFVEIDVRTTKDSQFVSIHNSSIDVYVEGATGAVRDFTLAELKQLDVGSRLGPEWAGTTIPTFTEILELCRGKIGIYLDLKDAPVAPLVELVKSYGMENNVLWYANTEELEHVKELCPECIIMPDPGPEENIGKIVESLHPKVIAPVWRYYSESFVRSVHKSGAIVIVDESTPACWEDALAWGSDGIQTNYPEELIRYLSNKSD